MDKIRELRMTAIILLVGLFLLSGCLFPSKHEVTFKTNGGTEVKSASVKSGNKLELPEDPKKEGYVFEGWYLNGKEFNTEEEIEEDITLVAKWRKIDVDGEEENKDEEEPTEEPTEKEKTTKKKTKKTTKTTKKKKKVTKKTTVASATVKKTTTTKPTTTSKKTSSSTTTTSSTTTSTTTKSTTTSTTTTTTKKIEEPTIPVEPTVPTEPEKPDVPDVTKPTVPVDPEKPTPDEPAPENPEIPDVEKKELKMNITVTEEEIRVPSLIDNNNVNNLTIDSMKLDNTNNLAVKEEIIKKYHMFMDLASENVNVISKLSDEDLQILLNSDVTKWQMYNQLGTILEIVNLDNKLEVTSDKEIITLTLMASEELNCVIYYDIQEEKWIIDYPSVMVTLENENKYYRNLEDAIGSSVDGSKVTLLKDMEIDKTIVIDKVLTIDGANFKIISKVDYLLDIRVLNREASIVLTNMNVEVDGLIKISEAQVKEIVMENIKGTYLGKIIENDQGILITQNNNELNLIEKTL